MMQVSVCEASSTCYSYNTNLCLVGLWACGVGRLASTLWIYPCNSRTCKKKEDTSHYYRMITDTTALTSTKYRMVWLPYLALEPVSLFAEGAQLCTQFVYFCFLSAHLLMKDTAL